ncbi:MAG TPA: acylphosphatase [Microlunatus sp.]
MIRRRVRITGRVQGVFFRDTCRREAHARGLAGWVTNLPDGSVAAVFEGPEADVDALVAWCGRGPSSARVDAVEVTDEEPQRESGFAIV